MKKLTSLIGSFFLATNLLNAEDVVENNTEELNKEFKFIGDISVSAGMTYATIDDILSGSKKEAGIIETDPIRWGNLRATFFPDIINLDISYGRTFSSPEDKSENVSISSPKNTAEQLKINIPISSFFMFKYQKYSFNSSFEATKDVYYIDRSNTTAASGNVYYEVDPGITKIPIGETTGASIDSQRYELAFVFDTTTTKGLRMFTFGVFQETLEKPWSDTRTIWYDTYTYEELAFVYKDARFKSTGITYGLTSNDKALKEGFSLSNMAFDLSVVDVSLTDNFNLDEAYKNVLNEYVTFYKMSLAMEFAYKTHTKFLGDRSNLLFAAFGKYDYYYTEGSSEADLSDDYFYGFRGTLTF